MYEFWFDYVKLKYCENAELCYLPIYKDIVENFEARFKTLNFETDRPLPKRKIKSNWFYERWISWTNHEKRFGLRAKTYSNLKDNNEEDKKAKGIKKCVMKRKFKFQDYKNCLEAAQIENEINHLEKNIIDVDSLKEFIKKTIN